MDIWPLLLARYPAGEYAVMQEVSDAAGFSRSRSADGIVVNLWPSRGLEISGLELKAYRGDWLRELKKPEKAENIFKYCDRWWLVTDDETIAKIEEIPMNWGWMCGNKNGTKMCIKKEAPLLKPEPVSRSFLAAMMKRATRGMIHKSSLENEIEVRAESLAKIKRDNSKYELDRKTEELDALRKRLSEFERLSGVKLDRYDMGNIAAAVKVLRHTHPEELLSKLVQTQNSISSIYDAITKGIKELQPTNGIQEQNNSGGLPGNVAASA